MQNPVPWLAEARLQAHWHRWSLNHIHGLWHIGLPYRKLVPSQKLAGIFLNASGPLEFQNVRALKAAVTWRIFFGKVRRD